LRPPDQTLEGLGIAAFYHLLHLFHFELSFQGELDREHDARPHGDASRRGQAIDRALQPGAKVRIVAERRLTPKQVVMRSARSLICKYRNRATARLLREYRKHGTRRRPPVLFSAGWMTFARQMSKESFRCHE
jgi:hypothetical protein